MTHRAPPVDKRFADWLLDPILDRIPDSLPYSVRFGLVVTIVVAALPLLIAASLVTGLPGALTPWGFEVRCADGSRVDVPYKVLCRWPTGIDSFAAEIEGMRKAPGPMIRAGRRIRS